MHSMLASIICHEFDKMVGIGQRRKDRKGMHVGFSLSTGDTTDQYRVCHMYIYAPMNYVHAASHIEIIDEESNRHTEPMEHLCYHDSCWRDAVSTYLFKNSHELIHFSSFDHIFDWYDVITLTADEENYLHFMDTVRHTTHYGSDKEKELMNEKLKLNPWDKRGIWAKTCKQ